MLSSAAALRHQGRKAADIGKIFARFGGLRIQLYPVTLLQRDAQLQGVDGVQPQAFNEQGGFVIDIGGGDVLKVEGGDNQLLQFQRQLVGDCCVHGGSTPQ